MSSLTKIAVLIGLSITSYPPFSTRRTCHPSSLLRSGVYVGNCAHLAFTSPKTYTAYIFQCSLFKQSSFLINVQRLAFTYVVDGKFNHYHR